MNESFDNRYKAFSEELERMYEFDQELRTRYEDNGGIIEDEKEEENPDKVQADRLKEIIKEIGWPTISKVGEKASKGAYILIQHADHDVAFQREGLKLMKEAGTDVDPHNVAYLEDRVRVNSGEPQLYGTQFFGEGADYGPRPIEDAEHLDERRAALGLAPMAEYKKELEEKYKLRE